MLKRIMIILLALVLLVGLLLIPASAASADPDDVPYIELTDYWLSPLDGLEIGAFYVSGSYSFAGNFSITLGQISGYGYEITYSYTGDRPAVTGVSLGGVSSNEFTSRYLDGTNIGKVRGDFKGATGSDVGISFSGSGCYITIHSFKVFLVDNFQVALSASLPDGSYFPSDDTSSLYTYSSILVDSWRNYDFIDLSFTCHTDALTSISAVLMDNTSDLETVIPCEVNYINRDYYQGTEKAVCVTVSCDLRGIDPATTPDSSLVVRITSNSNAGTLQVTSVYGVVVLHSPDQYTSWLKGLSGIGIETNEYLFEFLYEDFPAYLDKLEQYDAAAAQRATELVAQLVVLFQGLQNHNSSLIDDYKDWLTQLETEKWFVMFEPAFDTIFDKFDELINGTPVDPDAEQGMQDSADSLGSLGEQMQQGTPQIDANNVNVSLGYIPIDGSGDLAYTFFDLFWDQSYFLSMITTVFAVATMGFVFFGKKE